MPSCSSVVWSTWCPKWFRQCYTCGSLLRRPSIDFLILIDFIPIGLICLPRMHNDREQEQSSQNSRSKEMTRKKGHAEGTSSSSSWKAGRSMPLRVERTLNRREASVNLHRKITSFSLRMSPEESYKSRRSPEENKGWRDCWIRTLRY